MSCNPKIDNFFIKKYDGTLQIKAIEYLDNANNQRVAKKVDGVMVEKYLWANLTTLLAIYDKDDNLIQRFEYANNRMPISMSQDNQKYYLHYDQVGTLKAVSNSNQKIIKKIIYDTYGNIRKETNKDFKVPFGFAGGLYDADTKLTRFGYRDYDAYTGKWTAKDPIDFGGGDSNLYGYVLGDPVRFIDPTGEIAWIPLVVGGAAIYYTYQGLSSIYEWIQDSKNAINNPKELGDPAYNKQICDVAEGAREVGKEITHDALSAGIPFSRPIREAGGLIYDVAQ